MTASPVLCGGEILCDFFATKPGSPLSATSSFERRAGGSPFNIAVGVKRLGHSTAFLTKVGTDGFGSFLYETMRNEGLLLDATFQEPGAKTTLAFVAMGCGGKPDFQFYQDHAADTLLRTEETTFINPLDYSFFHFGSIALLDSPSREAYLDLFHRFQQARIPTSFDPNIRPSLIRDRKEYMELIGHIISGADIVKLSDEDLVEITGEKNIEKAIQKLPLRDQTWVFVTMGSKGAMVQTGAKRYTFQGFPTKVIDTTGCGDAFMAAIIHQYLQSPFGSDQSSIWKTNLLRFANAAAAIVASRKGASQAMPTLDEVEAFISRAES